MISLETAKALKDAGLAWKPKVGDRYLQEYCSGKEPVIGIRATDNEGYYQDTIQTQLPRLDQLLAEIVKNNWGYRLSVLWIEDFPKGYECLLSRTEETEEGKWEEYAQRFVTASPEEAAAQALLWILWKEGSAMPG